MREGGEDRIPTRELVVKTSLGTPADRPIHVARCPKGPDFHRHPGTAFLVMASGCAVLVALSFLLRLRYDHGGHLIFLTMVGPYLGILGIALESKNRHDFHFVPNPDYEMSFDQIRRCRLGPHYHDHVLAEFVVGLCVAIALFVGFSFWLSDGISPDPFSDPVALVFASALGSFLGCWVGVIVGKRHREDPEDLGLVIERGATAIAELRERDGGHAGDPDGSRERR